MAEQIIIPGVGDLIAGKYLIKTELGRGAYGVVFGCEQVDIGRYVAVKTLLPQAFLQGEIVKRFHREAQLISRLDHSNVIRLFDYGIHEDLLYMAVEFVSGETLGSLMKRTGPMDANVVVEISLQILAGLEHAHQAGIVHRDLKPENVIVIEKETGFEAKILDFGISKLIRGDEDQQGAMNTLTKDGAVLGTPHYMSPENIVGDPCDSRTDIYALGVMMYEMVSAEHPFDGTSPSAVFMKHLSSDAPLLDPEIQNSVLGATIFHALEKQPNDRIQSAKQMHEMLLSDSYVPRKSPTQQRDSKRRTTILAGLLFGAAVALLVFSAVYFYNISNREIIDISEKKAVPKKEAPSTTTQVLKPQPTLLEAVVVAKTLRNQATSRAHLDYRRSLNEKINLKTSEPTTKKTNKVESDWESVNDDPETRPVTVKFSSVPSNAVIKVNNIRIGKTPLSKTYSDPAVSLNVSFSHIGYTISRLRFSPEKRQAVHVKLKPSRLKID